jgi:hypothetical protein
MVDLHRHDILLHHHLFFMATARENFVESDPIYHSSNKQLFPTQVLVSSACQSQSPLPTNIRAWTSPSDPSSRAWMLNLLAE